MSLITSFILGLIEGLTEFAPVSSTFHLITASRLMGLKQDDLLKLFEVIVQPAAIFAILFLYLRELLTNLKLSLYVILSFIPTAIIGLILYPFIKGELFDSYNLQLFVFVLLGIIFILVEKYFTLVNHTQSKSLIDLTISHAILIGLFQSISIIPGVSRSGSILLGMLMLGYNRSDSAKYAFMLSLPTIASAGLLDIYHNYPLILSLSQSDLGSIILGSVVAFVSAIFVMKWLIKYLSSHNLSIFGYYRLVLALILLLFLR